MKEEAKCFRMKWLRNGRVAQLGEHLLCKQHHSFQLLHLFIWFPLFSTTWGICFSFEDNSKGLNVAHKCTVRVR